MSGDIEMIKLPNDQSLLQIPKMSRNRGPTEKSIIKIGLLVSGVLLLIAATVAIYFISQTSSVEPNGYTLHATDGPGGTCSHFVPTGGTHVASYAPFAVLPAIFLGIPGIASIIAAAVWHGMKM